MAEVNSFIWDEKNECMEESERRELVGKRLVSAVRRTYDNVPYYRRKLELAGLSPDDIKSMDDTVIVPITDNTLPVQHIK